MSEWCGRGSWSGGGVPQALRTRVARTRRRAIGERENFKVDPGLRVGSRWIMVRRRDKARVRWAVAWTALRRCRTGRAIARCGALRYPLSIHRVLPEPRI